MGDITTLLSTAKLQALIDNYDDRDMTNLLVKALVEPYPPSQAMIEAIAETFTEQLSSGVQTVPPPPLAAKDRERTLVTLCAARGEQRNLAIHIYSFLALNVSPRDLVQTLLLTGVYAGLPAFSNSLGVAAKTFAVLNALPASPKPTPAVVLPALLGAFP